MNAAGKGGALCPICREKSPVEPYRPFCSARCKAVDLNRWLGELYRIPEASRASGSGAKTDDEEA